MASSFGGTIKLEGAKQYKQDIASVNSYLRLLSKEMEGSAATVTQLTQKMNLYSDKVETQKRYIAELQEALAKASEKYGEFSDEADKWRTKLNNANATLLDMEKDLKAAQKELEDFSDKFKQSADKLKSAGEAMTGLGEKLSGLSTGAAAAVAAVVGVGVKSAQTADDLNTLSAVTGITTEELQKFAYASELIDVSQETVTGSLKKLITNMQAAQSGTEKQADAFKTLGVAYEDANGELRSNTDVFYEIIDALGKVENSTERDALAMTLFGKSAQDLNPLIKAGSESLKELGREAEDAGLILSQETLDDMNKLNDAVDKFKATLNADFTRLGANIAPVLTPILDDITKSLVKLTDKLSQFDTKTIETGLKVGVLAASLAPVLITLGKTMTAISQLLPLLGKIKTAMSALTAANVALLAIAAALVALNAAIDKANDKLDKTMVTSREVNKALAEQAQAYGEAKAAIDEKTAAESEEIGIARDLARRYEELATKTDRTAEEQAELAGVVDKLNQKFPDLKLSVDGATGSIKDQVKAIDELISAQERAVETTAAQEKYFAAKSNLQSVESQRFGARDAVATAMRGLDAQQKAALTHVISEYNKGILRVTEIDEVAEALMKNPNYDGDMRTLYAFKQALQDAQLAENSFMKAESTFKKAQAEYRARFAEQFNGGGKTGGASSGGKKVSGTSDLSDTVKEGLATWQYRYDAGKISTQEYIKELTRIRDTYFIEDSAAWREYDLKIINLQKSLGTKAAAAAASGAKTAAKAVKDETDKSLDELKKAYQKQQAFSYDWIGERVYKGDFANFGTTANESYERIYQRAREAFNAGILSIDELADEADRITAAKLADYNTEKQKLTNFIDDRKFYDDWNKVNTTEEKVLQQMLDNADRYYAEGILDYKQYAEEVRQINRSIYTAQAAEQESVLSLAQDRVEKQLSEKKAEIDRQTAALNAQVSELRAKYTTEDRRKRMAELKEEISDYQNAVTLKGQEHLKSLQDEAERLRREQEIEDLQKQNNEIIMQLEAEYKALETEKTSLLTKIADNTAELNKFTAAVAGISESVSTAVQTTLTKIIQDNSVQNNYNTNNASQYVTAAQGVDVQAIMSAFTRGLKG